VGLRLHPDTDVLDWRRQNGVCYASKGTCRVVLRVRQGLRLRGLVVDRLALSGGILSFEGAASVVESTELNGDARSNADQRCGRALVESCSAFILEDLRRTI